MQNTTNLIDTKTFSKLPCIAELKEQSILDPYRNTAFYELKCASSKKKGAIMEKVYQQFLENLGYKVGKSLGGTSEHDRVLYLCEDKDGKILKVEIKGSFGWVDKKTGLITHFRWQQIRNQDYDVVVYLAFYPDRVEIYFSNKEEVMEYVTKQDEDGHWPCNQHGGKKENSGTYFLDGFPADFPFMKPHDEVVLNE